MISIFYLPFRHCSLELQKIIVRFSHENVRGCIPLLKSLHRLLTDREFMIMLSALILISYLPIRYCSLIEIFYTFSTLRTPHPAPLIFHRTKKCRARPGIRSLARHFFLVILPSSLFQPFCCVRSLVSKTLLFCVCTDITLPLTPGQNERVCVTHARGTWFTNFFFYRNSHAPK